MHQGPLELGQNNEVSHPQYFLGVLLDYLFWGIQDLNLYMRHVRMFRLVVDLGRSWNAGGEGQRFLGYGRTSDNGNVAILLHHVNLLINQVDHRVEAM